VKYSQNKTYIVKMNNVKKLMEKIESISSVLWANGETPTEYRPFDENYCFYNGDSEYKLTYADEDYVIKNQHMFFVELTEDEFVEMLSILAPKE
jgi:thiamine pyrophosphokinase